MEEMEKLLMERSAENQIDFPQASTIEALTESGRSLSDQLSDANRELQSCKRDLSRLRTTESEALTMPELQALEKELMGYLQKIRNTRLKASRLDQISLTENLNRIRTSAGSPAKDYDNLESLPPTPPSLD